MVTKIVNVVLANSSWFETVQHIKTSTGFVNVRKAISEYEENTQPKRFKTQETPDDPETDLPPVTPETDSTPDEDEDIKLLSKADKHRLETYITKLHNASGHPPNRVLVHALQLKNSKPVILKLASKHYCSACEENRRPKSRPAVNMNSPKEQWKTVGIDFKEFFHRSSNKMIKFAVMVD
jgi:hypothetical protein